MQKGAGTLKMEKMIITLDTIGVRSMNVTEVWQEGGEDFITVRFLANLMDYTESESGELLPGSNTEPVKFVEYWTFTRTAGNNRWQFSAVNQEEQVLLRRARWDAQCTLKADKRPIFFSRCCLP